MGDNFADTAGVPRPCPSSAGPRQRSPRTPHVEHLLPEPPEWAQAVQRPVTSLAGGSEPWQAVVAGLGAVTLVELSAVARSTDGGSSWQRFEVPEVEGQRGYVASDSPGVVLPDGQLLVLIGHWSGDRPRKPSDLHHGLWVSDGADWSTYEPWHPSFDPSRGERTVASLGADRSGRTPLVWVTTADDRLLLATDGTARSFRELPAR